MAKSGDRNIMPLILVTLGQRIVWLAQHNVDLPAHDTMGGAGARRNGKVHFTCDGKYWMVQDAKKGEVRGCAHPCLPCLPCLPARGRLCLCRLLRRRSETA